MSDSKPVVNKTLLKVGILATSLMLQAASAISVAVTGMTKAFDGQSTTSIQALVTIPSFSIMLFVLASTWIVKLIGKRNTVVLGLALALIGGVGPAFVDNFTAIEVLRFLFGAGTGIYTSLAVSLIGDFFSGDEQRNLLGLQSAISSLGSSLSTFVAGLLVGISWQSTYLVYFVLLPVIIIFLIGYPRQPKTSAPQATAETKGGKTGSKKISIYVLAGMLILFVYFNAMMALYTNSGLALQEMHMANQNMLGTSLAVAGIIGSLITMLYGPIYRVLKHVTPIVFCGIGVVGFFWMSHATSMLFFTIAAVMVSSTAILIPYVYGTVMDSVPDSTKNFAISLAMVLNNLGASFSPYTLSFLGKTFQMTSYSDSFVICAVIMILLAVAFGVMLLSRNRVAAASQSKA
jgi:MFS family permease